MSEATAAGTTKVTAWCTMALATASRNLIRGTFKVLAGIGESVSGLAVSLGYLQLLSERAGRTLQLHDPSVQRLHIAGRLAYAILERCLAQRNDIGHGLLLSD